MGKLKIWWKQIMFLKDSGDLQNEQRTVSQSKCKTNLNFKQLFGIRKKKSPLDIDDKTNYLLSDPGSIILNIQGRK